MLQIAVRVEAVLKDWVLSVFQESDCQLGLSQRDMAGIGGHLVKHSKAEKDKCTSLLGSVINGAVTGGILGGDGNL